MGRYDSHKNPFSYVLNQWAHRQTNNSREREPKSMPVSVKQVEKDFLHMNFETKNSIFTPPVMKMAQSFSRFGREPTQEKDMGMAVPGDYYMGAMTAFAGGGTNFYPRGNLSSLTFQPMSNLKAPKRDYDQHHETGGPNGWRVKVMEDQQEKQQQASQSGGSGGVGGSGSASSAAMRVMRQTMPIRTFAISPLATGDSSTSSNGSTGSSKQTQEQKDSKTEFSFDKDDKALIQSKDTDHYMFVDGKKQDIVHNSAKTIHMQLKDGGDKIVHNPSDAGKVYVGGDPDKKHKFARVLTEAGPSKWAMGRIG